MKDIWVCRAMHI